MDLTEEGVEVEASEAVSTDVAEVSEGGGGGGDVSPARLSVLAGSLTSDVASAAKEITRITGGSRLLAVNARIEASRAGGVAGESFAVVASEMAELAATTARVAEQMKRRVFGSIKEIKRISDHLSYDVRGTRLADLAATNIDLIDRNLYERSCDCRWWATDPALVAALESPTPEALALACKRMGVILSAYTVYFDLVLCDAEGRVVASGRNAKYGSIGRSCIDGQWFRDAMATVSGDRYTFQSVHRSSLAGDERALIYSAAVRKGGETDGRPMGALGVVFNWDGLAKRIVEETPLSPDEKGRTRVVITDDAGQVLSDTDGRELITRFDEPEIHQLMRQPKGFSEAKLFGKQHLVAHGSSRGFEGYATGWHCLILHRLEAANRKAA